jgi:hypothetical protein
MNVRLWGVVPPPSRFARNFAANLAGGDGNLLPHSRTIFVLVIWVGYLVMIHGVNLGWEHPNTQTSITNYLAAKLIALGKIVDAQTEGIKYIEEHPDEVQELLNEVFFSSNESGEVSNEGGGSSNNFLVLENDLLE